MTEHSTEELKRQYDAALSRASAATVAADDARERWYAALIRDKLAEFVSVGGAVGLTRVRKRRDWIGAASPDMSCGPYVVAGAEVGLGAARYVLAKIKKNGAPFAEPSSKSEHVFIIAEDQPK